MKASAIELNRQEESVNSGEYTIRVGGGGVLRATCQCKFSYGPVDRGGVGTGAAHPNAPAELLPDGSGDSSGGGCSGGSCAGCSGGLPPPPASPCLLLLLAASSRSNLSLLPAGHSSFSSKLSSRRAYCMLWSGC